MEVALISFGAEALFEDRSHLNGTGGKPMTMVVQGSQSLIMEWLSGSSCVHNAEDGMKSRETPEYSNTAKLVGARLLLHGHP
jgi:hypothetical protein